MFQRRLGLEQRRYVDLVFDAEQFCEIECGKNCGGLFAFGDEHADRCVGINVLEDLRHGQKLAHGGAALHGERGEVGRKRFGIPDQIAQGPDRALTSEI